MSVPGHFQCTACGKCCHGQVPLTWKDAVAFAGLFPLAMVWTPVQRGSKDFRMTRELGALIALPDGTELATLIVPTAFLPPTFPCPALVDGKMCGIHRDKPSRCKTMPFYPYRDERFQGDMLRPHQDWECDVSDQAPLVYDGKRIVFREDFDKEKQELIEQVPLLRRYAEYMLKYQPALPLNLRNALQQGANGHLVTSLSSMLTALHYGDAARIAGLQAPLMEAFAARTAGEPKLASFHQYYKAWAKEMAYLVRPSAGTAAPTGVATST